MSQLRKKIQTVWQKGAVIGDERGFMLAHHRYVPRAYGPKGPGWGVFDQVKQRFVEDSELRSIPIDAIAFERVPGANQ